MEADHYLRVLNGNLYMNIMIFKFDMVFTIFIILGFHVNDQSNNFEIKFVGSGCMEVDLLII